jgi:hypothetical protein
MLLKCNDIYASVSLRSSSLIHAQELKKQIINIINDYRSQEKQANQITITNYITNRPLARSGLNLRCPVA